MELRLHANATTTPKTRAYIQSSTASVAELAGELGVSEDTIRRWRSRTEVSDHSHTPHKLAIGLSDLEERLVTELRTALGLPLDDIVEVMRRCVNPKLSRSGIHRCLSRHGISARPKPAKPPVGAFESASVGFIHIDLKHLTRLGGRPSFVFVAIDRATRFVHACPREDGDRDHQPARRRHRRRLPGALSRRLPASGAHHPDRSERLS